jgi:hypothetical protein
MSKTKQKKPKTKDAVIQRQRVQEFFFFFFFFFFYSCFFAALKFRDSIVPVLN